MPGRCYFWSIYQVQYRNKEAISLVVDIELIVRVVRMITPILEKLYAEATDERSIELQSHSKDRHGICSFSAKVKDKT